MSRRLLFFLLILALVLIAGYLVLQIFLRTSIQKEAAASPAPVAKTDTLGGKKTSALDLRPLFVERMQQLLQKSSSGLYVLSVGDLRVDVLSSTVSLQNVTVRPNEKVRKALQANGSLPGDVFTVAFKSLVIEGINLDDAIKSKAMDYKLVKLVNPVIEIDHRKAKKEKKEEDFSQRFLKEMEKLSIARLVVDSGSVVVHDKQKGTTKKLAAMKVRMGDILLNEQTRTDENRFLFAKEAKLDFHGLSIPTPDGLYNFRIGDVSVDASQKTAALKNISFASPLSKEAFVKKQKIAKELFNLDLPAANIKGIDWWAMLNGDEIIANNVQTTGGKLAVYFDRNLPPRNRVGNFPSQLLMKLPVKLNIEKMQMKNLDVSYEEHNPVSGQSGTVYLDNTSLDFANVSNTGSKPILVNGTALLAHKVPVQASFRFDMKQYKSGKFSASISSNTPFDGTLLNAVSMPLGMLKLQSGTLQKLSADIAGDEQSASGDVTVLYNDLKLSLLEKDKGKTALDKKDVTTFLANLFVLKKDNPKNGKAPQTEQAKFTRDPTGGFVMVVWKTVLVGILKTIGAPEKMAYKKPAKAKP